MAKTTEDTIIALQEELDEANDKIEDLKDKLESAYDALKDIADMAYKAT